MTRTDQRDPAGRIAVTPPVEPPAGGRCPACGRDDRRLRRVTAEATAGTIAVLAEGFPVAVCPCGEVAVTTDVREATGTAWRAVLPVADRRWLRPDACTACGAGLTMPVRRTTRAVTVTPASAPVATLRFDLPMQRCAACGGEQVPDRSRPDLPAAVDAVFVALGTAAGPPDGR